MIIGITQKNYISSQNEKIIFNSSEINFSWLKLAWNLQNIAKSPGKHRKTYINECEMITRTIYVSSLFWLITLWKCRKNEFLQNRNNIGYTVYHNHTPNKQRCFSNKITFEYCFGYKLIEIDSLKIILEVRWRHQSKIAKGSDCDWNTRYEKQRLSVPKLMRRFWKERCSCSLACITYSLIWHLAKMLKSLVDFFTVSNAVNVTHCVAIWLSHHLSF